MARAKFLCDAERCIECNACVTACKNEHEVPWGINRRRVVTIQDGNPGVWIKRNNTFFKIASVGVRISHWITWHGISINVNPNLEPFKEIIPCGVQNGFVTSIEKEGKKISLNQFDKKLKENFSLFF